ncbi:LuxR family transcriptional regulator [soil metagenome]
MISGDYGRLALDFVERLEDYTTAPTAMNAIEDAFRAFGFETVIITGLPNPDQQFAKMVLAKRWPPGWFELYTAENYDRHDPVARHCRRTVSPFEWSEAPFDAEAEPRAAEVMRRAADFRMSRGFLIPIHGLAGYDAAISLGGCDIDLNARNKPALHLMAMYGFERIRRLTTPSQGTQHRLTRREREALTWTAKGKSAWEIGEILNITQRTAEEHIATASRRLGAANKTHAVAIAIRDKMILP